MIELLMRRRGMAKKAVIPVIEFEDTLVKEICVANWGGLTGGSTNVPGIAGEMTYQQAAAVTTIQTKFNGKAITKFNELYYFENAQVPGNAFQNCSSLVEVSLPKNMTALPGNTSSFKNNVNTVVYFPEGYEDLKYSTFGAGCDNVTLILPTTLTIIRGGALYSGTNYVLVIKATATESAGPGINNKIASVYVPDSAVDTYKEAANWSGIATKIHPISEYTGSIVSPVW